MMNTSLNIIVEFSSHTVEKVLHYPEEHTVAIPFKNVKKPITIKKIVLNNIVANPSFNTSFHIDYSDTVLYSVHTIEKDGIFILQIDDFYLQAHRSSNWYCSPSKEDFVFNHEFTRDSFSNTYRDRNHIGFDQPFVPCFGCSFTYGQSQPDTHTWPYLLAKKTSNNFLNLGVPGSGIDGMYNNLKLLYQKHKFTQTVLLFPNFERRIVRSKIDNVWLRLFSNSNIKQIDNLYHFYTDYELRKRWEIVNKKIVMDETNRYSKRFLHKIINFCKANSITLYCSSYIDDTYEYLQQVSDITLLPKFPSLLIFPERADDGWHPHKKHYEYFVDSIYKNW